MWTIPFFIVALFVPRGTAFGTKFLRFFMQGEMFIAGVRVRVHGKLSDARPLLIVGNHISIFEFATFPVAFGNSFFAKKEMESFPLVGWLSAKFGVTYIDRRPSQAIAALATVRNKMARATWPMVLFPEGTTTNGAYVREFKSTLFNFLETENGIEGATIQPVVQFYRRRDGTKISDVDMAEHYAYFNNRDQTFGPHASVERSWVAQLFHVFAMGGMTVEIHVLPPPPLAGIKDRKELAVYLHKIVSDKYMEFK